MQNYNECPVMTVIYGSNYDPTSDDNLIIGSNEQTVADEISYHITCKKIDIARFEINSPSSDQCKRKYKQLFGAIVGQPYETVYKKIIDTIMSCILYDTLISLRDLLTSLEDLILSKTMKSRTLNISLPDFDSIYTINRTILYVPDKVYNLTKTLASAMCTMNINCMLSSPVNMNMIEIKQPITAHEWTNDVIIKCSGSSLDDIKKTFAQELEILNYAADVEKYYCHIANCIHSLISHINKVVNLLK